MTPAKERASEPVSTPAVESSVSRELSHIDKLDNEHILVIGGAGFVGSHVVDELLKEPVARIVVLDNFVRGSRTNLASALQDERVRIVEGSVTDRTLLRRLMSETDFCVHLAALWLGECVSDPRAALDVNVGGTFNVVEAAHGAGIRRVVYSSSASVYGDAIFTPMTEEHPFNNRTMYGATKIAGEQFFRAFNEQHDLDYVGLRYMNIYGPRMDYSGTYVSVIMKVLDRLDDGQRPVVFGDGTQSYDFIHVHDVARANVLALKSDAADRFYNIGMGVKTSLNELVALILELTEHDLQIEYRPEAQSFVTHRIGSTEAAETDLGFKAQIPLAEGLKSLIDWRREDKSRPLAGRP